MVASTNAAASMLGKNQVELKESQIQVSKICSAIFRVIDYQKVCFIDKSEVYIQLCMVCCKFLIV